MKIFASLLLVLLSIASSFAISASGVDNRTVDGRFGTKCLPIDDHGGEVCDVSIYRLIANPEKYHKRKIRVTGFLVRTLGGYVIFPSKSDFLSSGGDGGIEILGPFDIHSVNRINIEDGKAPITVIGRFDAWYQGRGVPRVGSISPNNVYYLQNISEAKGQAKGSGGN